MKKVILLLSITTLIFGTVSAQTTIKSKKTKAQKVTEEVRDVKLEAPAVVAPVAVQVEEADSKMKFSVEEHDFGTIPEGPAVSYDFEFKNISKEPIQLEHVQASCGCTTPEWSKDPIMPGGKSAIKVGYNTSGRVGSFTKTITVTSNSENSTVVLTIKGNVKAKAKS